MSFMHPNWTRHAHNPRSFYSGNVRSRTRSRVVACTGAHSGTVSADPSTSSVFQRPSRLGMEDARGRLLLKNLTLPELESWCISLGERPQRAMQIWRWMYADGLWVQSLEDTIGQQNGLRAPFCEAVASEASISGELELRQVVTSQDGTIKLILEVASGQGRGSRVETVLIPVVRERGKKPRMTVCVSSQVGCAMNCQFCYTGRMGLLGNLSTAQIVEQVVMANRVLRQQGLHIPITNIVFMGMGEPLHNMDSVLAAVSILCHPLGLHQSHNKVTVSTVGLVPEIARFLAATRCQLALSLHATTDEVRDWIVPVNRRYPLSDLISCLSQHFPRNNPEGTRVLIEYVMLRGVNDTLADAARLLVLLEPIEAKVNLIVFNPHQGTRFAPSDMDQVLAFRSVLIRGGRVCTIRDSRGDDEMAACGQLGNVELSSKFAPLLPPPPHLAEALLPLH